MESIDSTIQGWYRSSRTVWYIEKGFLGTALLWAIPYILLGLFGALLFPLLPRNEFSAMGMLLGAGVGFFFILAYIASIIWSFVMVAVGSYVFNWVALKMGGTDDVQSVMKVQWYLQGYEVLLCTCVYTIVFYSHGYLRWPIW